MWNHFLDSSLNCHHSEIVSHQTGGEIKKNFTATPGAGSRKLFEFCKLLSRRWITMAEIRKPLNIVAIDWKLGYYCSLAESNTYGHTSRWFNHFLKLEHWRDKKWMLVKVVACFFAPLLAITLEEAHGQASASASSNLKLIYILQDTVCVPRRTSFTIFALTSCLPFSSSICLVNNTRPLSAPYSTWSRQCWIPAGHRITKE